MFLRASLTKKQVHQFTFQLANLLKGRLPLIEAMQLIASTSRSKAFKHFLNEVIEQISYGKSLHNILKQYPNYFNHVFLQLVKIGENTGSLTIIMMQLAGYQHQQQLLQRKLIKALSYPLFVLGFALVISMVLLVKIIPQFAELFLQFEQELPRLTERVIATSFWLQDNSLNVLLFTLGFLVMIWNVRRIKFLNRLIAELLIRLPFPGKMIVYRDVIKYSQTLQIMMSAKVSLNKALQVAANLDVNLALQQQFQKLALAVEYGTGINPQQSNKHPDLHKVQNKRYAVLPEYLIQVLSVGEQSGQLEQLLDVLIDDYQQNFNYLVQLSMSFVEPLLMVFLGLFIGLILLSVYLPLFNFGSLF